MKKRARTQAARTIGQVVNFDDWPNLEECNLFNFCCANRHLDFLAFASPFFPFFLQQIICREPSLRTLEGTGAKLLPYLNHVLSTCTPAPIHTPPVPLSHNPAPAFLTTRSLLFCCSPCPFQTFTAISIASHRWPHPSRRRRCCRYLYIILHVRW